MRGRERESERDQERVRTGGTEPLAEKDTNVRKFDQRHFICHMNEHRVLCSLGSGRNVPFSRVQYMRVRVFVYVCACV